MSNTNTIQMDGSRVGAARNAESQWSRFTLAGSGSDPGTSRLEAVCLIIVVGGVVGTALLESGRILTTDGPFKMLLRHWVLAGMCFSSLMIFLLARGGKLKGELVIPIALSYEVAIAACLSITSTARH